MITAEGVISSVHGPHQKPLFKDSEILEIFPSVREEALNPQEPVMLQIRVQVLENQKRVIQQQALRGCTAGASAMLISDAGLSLPTATLRGRNLSPHSRIINDIENMGLKAIENALPRTTDALAWARHVSQLLTDFGSGALGLDSEIGGHVIVLDQIQIGATRETSSAVIRDPWHGWAIRIPLDSLLRRLSLPLRPPEEYSNNIEYEGLIQILR